MAQTTASDVKRNKNSILFDLPQTEWDRLRLHVEQIDLPARTLLYSRHEIIGSIYFPERGFVSMMIDFADGFQAETGQIGSEGIVGVPLVHGLRMDTAAAVVQTRTVALRMPAPTFAREIDAMPVLKGRLSRYSEILRAQAMQLAACNGHHGLDARLARCLLSMHDRYEAYELPVTHELLATLLCAHRPSISVSAKRLQGAGLIRYSGGMLSIVDRHGLERVSCECYEIMHDLAHGI